MIIQCIIAVVMLYNGPEKNEYVKNFPVDCKVIEVINIDIIRQGYKHIDVDCTKGFEKLNYSKTNSINIKRRIVTSDQCYGLTKGETK